MPSYPDKPIPSARIASADAPPLPKPQPAPKRAHKHHNFPRDINGHSIRLYASTRRAQTPLPDDVTIEARFRGTTEDMKQYTWQAADVAGLIQWQLMRITGPSPHDREQIPTRMIIGNGRQAGFDAALDALAVARPDWPRPTGIIMPRRTPAPPGAAAQFKAERARLIDERERLDAALQAASARAKELMRERDTMIRNITANYDVKIDEPMQQAHAAIAANRTATEHVEWALSQLGEAI